METTYTTVLVARNFLEIMAQKYKIKSEMLSSIFSTSAGNAVR